MVDARLADGSKICYYPSRDRLPMLNQAFAAPLK
jgi:hypothetical protein